MIRKIVTALILVPLAIVFIALAVANRQPFSSPSIPSIRSIPPSRGRCRSMR
jgi:hypothetical protein